MLMLFLVIPKYRTPPTVADQALPILVVSSEAVRGYCEREDTHEQME